MMKLHARLVDITTLNVDAIVNAANSELAAGGGVCGAIFRAAGPGLRAACDAIGGCPTGDARITPGFALPANYIVHAVGPVWHGGMRGESALLASAYRNALMVARDAGCRSIAFPAISTGIYGFPLGAATKIAVETVRGFAVDAGGLDEVWFACFSEDALRGYVQEGVLQWTVQ